MNMEYIQIALDLREIFIVQVVIIRTHSCRSLLANNAYLACDVLHFVSLRYFFRDILIL